MGYVFEIHNPGPRPPFSLVAENLWGKETDIDSDGNSKTPEDSQWTELTLILRSDESLRVDVDPKAKKPLVLAVRSNSFKLAKAAAVFLHSFSGGELINTNA